MACFLKNYGLAFLLENEETFNGFLACIAQESKVLPSYYGAPYLTHTMGDTEFWVQTERSEENSLAICALNTHNSGNCVWELQFSDIEITPKKDMPYCRTFLFNHTEGGGLLPVQLINADVLPGMLPDDRVRMQVVALPLCIDYYADETEYADAQPANERGKKWLCANGTLFPLSFLSNHAIDKDPEEQDFSSDSYVHFTATVTDVFHGRFALGDQTHNTFIRCFADTSFGKLEFIHTIDQVEEAQRKNIGSGSIISGVCILSADVAIDEYKNGIVKDHEHNLQLLRHTFVHGEAERLHSVLAEDAVYTTDSATEIFVGPQAIIERLHYVHENCNCKYYAYTAEITETENADLQYPVGTRCIVLTTDKDDGYVSIAFVEEDEEGRITSITISQDSRYGFRADLPEEKPSPLEKIHLPESVTESMLARARFHEIIDPDLDESKIWEDTSESQNFLQNAQWMWEALREQPQSDVETATKNVFGYLFAKAIEMTYRSKETDVSPSMQLTVSYCPSDALAGKIHSTLSEARHAALEKAMKLGTQFYNDLKFFVEREGFPEEKFTEVFAEATLLTQRLGQLYTDRCFPEE